MICQPCRDNILDGAISWGMHRLDYYHKNLDLELEKCTFCSQLRKDVQKLSPDVNTYPAYRWSMYSSPSIRETPESARYTTITFRPVLDQSEAKLNSRSETLPWGSLPIRAFYIFDPAALSVPSSLPPSTDITSAAALDHGESNPSQVQKWINTCLNSHERCSSSPSSSWTPTRLLDISRPPTPTEPVYIIHTASHPEFTGSSKPAYVTLSHCWGSHPMIKLTSSSLPQFTDPKAGIPWNLLPKTFRQAIEVARTSLGVKYIWIDSLCIIQWSSPTDKGDFETEGQLMHRVYRYSFCNIAAVASRDSRWGLFRPVDDEYDGLGDGGGGGGEMKREELIPDMVTVRGVARPGDRMSHGTNTDHDEREKRFAVLRGDLWTDGLLSGLLYTRGWVFQERMLAPRILHFSTQIFFDCATTSACEVLPMGLPPPLDTVAATERHWREMLLLLRGDMHDHTHNSPDTGTADLTGTADVSLETLWRAAVRRYTACNLTNYGSDRLAAIWGVAKIIRDRLRAYNKGSNNEEEEEEEEEYVAGLWRKNLYEQLAWRVITSTARSGHHSGGERLPELKKHPSWSWASIRGEIVVPRRFGIVRTYIVTDHDGGDVKFGEVEYRYEGGDLESGRDVVRERDDDFEPVLKDKRLAIKGLLIPATWKAVGCRSGMEECQHEDGSCCSWTLEVNDNYDGSGKKVLGGARLDVYPDVMPNPTPAGGNSDGNLDQECYVLILALEKPLSSKRIWNRQEDSESLEDGTGLLLKFVSESAPDAGVPGYGHKQFERLGAFKVWGVDKDEFDKLLEENKEDFYLV